MTLPKPRWPGDRHAKPGYTMSPEPVLVSPGNTLLSRYCVHKITVYTNPKVEGRNFPALRDWIDEGTNGCQGLYLVTHVYGIYLGEIRTERIEHGISFECPATAMMVKMHWG